jgi:hypothetical protein
VKRSTVRGNRLDNARFEVGEQQSVCRGDVDVAGVAEECDPLGLGLERLEQDERVGFRLVALGEQREGERRGEEREQIERVGRPNGVVELEAGWRPERLEQDAAVLGIKHGRPRGSQSRARG